MINILSRRYRPRSKLKQAKDNSVRISGKDILKQKRKNWLYNMKLAAIQWSKTIQLGQLSAVEVH
jgi:hypothetical protein